MKFEVAQEMFAKFLSSVLGAVPAKTTTPILSHLVLEVVEKRLRCVATDLEIAVTRETEEISAAEEGAVTIPAKKLSEVVGVLPSGKVRFSADAKSRVEIRAGKTEILLTGGSREAYPSIPAVGEEVTFPIPAENLAALLDATIFAAGSEEIRTFLNGANFHLEEKNFRVVATDGHRLAFAEEELPKVPKGLSGKKTASVVVPFKALREVRRLLPAEGKVIVTIAGNQAAFAWPGVSIVSRLIAEPFPNYEAVIPKKTTKTATLEASALSRSLHRALPIADGRSGLVRLAFGAKALRVTSETSDIGAFKEDLPLEYEGDPLEIAFNAHYLIDYLRTVPEGEVRIELSETANPALLRPGKKSKNFYVVMPMRI